MSPPSDPAPGRQAASPDEAAARPGEHLLTAQLERKEEHESAASAEKLASKQAPYVLPKMRWHQSWIMQLAAVAAFILLLGYLASAFFAFESIEAIAKLAHDRDIEKSLSAHLDSIKRVHALKQELIVERLRTLLPADPTLIGTSEVTQALAKAQVDMGSPLDEVQLTLAPDPQPGVEGELELRWLTTQRLRVGKVLVDFPKGSSFEAFENVQSVRQRYQLIGAKLDENIRPALVRATVATLVVSFLLLVSIVFIYARVFMKRVGEVIDGFAIWSEKDPFFRFAEVHSGELKLITSQFNHMADEVEANRQRSIFLEKIASWQIIARKLAHEIKNPLTPIQMMVGQLKRRYKGDDEAFAKLLDNAQSIITEEVAGLRRMVDNFSNFARLPQPEPKTTDLVPLCAHVVELQRNVFQHHEIALRHDEAKVTAIVDEDLVRQVLINLVKNAGEACGDKASKIIVRLPRGRGDWVTIEVEDDGPGIPAEHLSRVFEAYFTTKHTGPSPGMGLGLAVCQKIVMDHGGKMTVTSRPGQTVFTLRFPKRPKG